MSNSAIVLQGDCLEVLKDLPDDSIDSMVTDPPSSIGFMGKEWDSDKGGRKQWIAWLASIMLEAKRVMKPGAHALVWAIPRTSHWTATALEDAGFEIRDVVTHLFGSGFPKSLDISKAIDKAAGAEREVISNARSGSSSRAFQSEEKTTAGIYNITQPASPDAKRWQGFGTALKPASEHWILCRKPCSEKTVAKNVLLHGTGGINIDASRIKSPDVDLSAVQKSSKPRAMSPGGDARNVIQSEQPMYNNQGRFPANLVLSHNPDCVEGFTPGEVPYGNSQSCTPGCAVAMLDEQSGFSKTPKSVSRNARIETGKYGDYGAVTTQCAGDSGASRFFFNANYTKDELCQDQKPLENVTLPIMQMNSELGEKDLNGNRFIYCAKASKSEKNAGLEGILTWENQDQNLQDRMVQLNGLLKDIYADIVLNLSDNEWNIILSGNNTTASFQKDFKYTISIILKTITELKISNALLHSNIKESILDAIRMIEMNGLSLVEAADAIKKSLLTTTNEKMVTHMSVNLALLQELNEIRKLAKEGNIHATVKSQKLMAYLIRLITPPNGIVLDPFTGSGSIGVAAINEGFSFIGIEREEEYLKIAEARIAHAEKQKETA